MALSTIQNNSFADTAVHGFRNLIINGAMQIYQRGAGTLASGQFGPDRFEWGTANLDNLAGTLTQDSDAPDNFSSSLKITVTTAETSIASDEYAYLHQRIEAQNLQGLGYGTSSAKQVTLSFWVKSSVTGTFAVGLYKGDNTVQIHNKTYTINSAGTWEYKTVTFSANTLSGGAIDNDSGIGLYVSWHLGAGSTYKGTSSSSGWISYVSSSWADGQDTDAVLTTTNATWQITGVQLEVGSEPTPFEHRSYADELFRCERYLQQWGVKGSDNHAYAMWVYVSNNVSNFINLKQQMRTVPTITIFGSPVNTSAGSVGPNTWAIYQDATWRGCNLINTAGASAGGFRLNTRSNDSISIGACGLYGGVNCYLELDAEL